MSVDLTPTEELMMDVLAARHRLGDTTWTFSTKASPAAQRLERKGLARWKYGIVEKTILVSLTEEGKKEWLRPGFDTEVSKAEGITLSLTLEEANAVADGLSYYGLANEDNFGQGYFARDSEDRERHYRAREVMDRIVTAVEEHEGSQPTPGIRATTILRVNLPADPEPRRELNPELRTTCFNPHPHSPHAWDVEDRTRLRYSCVGIPFVHAPNAPVPIQHPGGKDGWWRCDCIVPDCDYHAIEFTPEKAAKRVRQHAASKNGDTA